MRASLPFLGLVCLALAPTARALDRARPADQYSHTVWQIEQGLPQNSVQSILQARDGFLWVGTAEGLARFDGQRFTPFTGATAPALGTADIQFIAEASDGAILVGAYGAGLVRYRDGAFERLAPKGEPDLSDLAAMTADGSGHLWTGGDQGRLYRVTGSDVEPVETGGPGGGIRALQVDTAGALWIGTTAGLGCRTSTGTQWLTERDGLLSPQVTALAADGHGGVWVGTSAGLQRVMAGRLQPVPGLFADPVRTLVVDRQDALWVGSARGLTRILDGKATSQLGPEAGLGAVRALAEDSDGSLWVGTFSNGLSQLKDGAIVAYTRSHGLANDGVGSVAAGRDGGLWLAVGGGIVHGFSHGELRTLGGPGPGKAEVSALHEDRAGRLWAGTERGLAVWQGDHWRRLGAAEGMPARAVTTLADDAQGRLWIGLDGAGAVRLENGHAVPVPRTLFPGDHLRALLAARDGRVFVGTYDGLAVVDGERARLFTTRDGLATNLVRALHEDAQGVLWVGTYGGGVTRLKDGRLATIRASQGLHSDIVYAIVEDDAGRLWMSCNRGIFSVDKAELDAVADGRATRVRSRVYGRSDGMLSVECNGGAPAAARTADGRIWFATVKGLVVLDPQAGAHRHTPAAPPAPRLERVLVDGSPVPGDAIRLPPGARRVRFEFTSPSFLAPERLAYSHQLEGFDHEWHDEPRNSAEYTNLAPGQYRFRVRVTDENGLVGELAAPVGVAAAWYQTRLFALSGVGALFLAAFGAYRMRTAALRGREKALQKRVDAAVADVHVLTGMLPICSSCKKIRDDQGYWSQIENYIEEHSRAEFTHGICPDCAKALYPGLKSTGGGGRPSR